MRVKNLKDFGLKVVFVTQSLDPQHGAGTAERTRRLAAQLVRLGCACLIISPSGTSWLHELNGAGVRVYLTGQLGTRFPVPVPNPARIWHAIRDADVVHVMGYWYLLAVIVSFACRLSGRPFALCPAGELAVEFRNTPLKQIFYKLFGRTMLATAASVIATTSRERDEILALDVVGPARITISPNGIASSAIDDDRSMALPTKPFVLFMGRLTAIKGPDLLVEAFAKIGGSVPDLSLVMAGPDFGMRVTLEARVQALGLRKRIAFLGFVDEAARGQLYRNAEFLVVPSRSEVMSMVALEAAAAATPVLLTDRCGFDEVQAAGGGLVVSADAAGLADGMARMLDGSCDLRLMGERLHSLVLRRYAWPIVASQLQSHLAELGRVSSPCTPTVGAGEASGDG